nr:uracil-DNA glycosylase [Deinococcus budaensis]
MGALEGRARGCAACPLRPGSSQVVVGEGDPAAPLVIVGEAPGGEEDRTGQPFAGAAGELLDRILAAVDLSRGDAYLTTVVQCRPPGDRAPHPLEVETCTALWLRPRLGLLRSRVILSLGNTATQHLLGTRQGITQLRGRWYAYGGSHGTLLMPLFHPAYLLRETTRIPGGPRSLTWRDIREAAAVLRGEKAPAELASAAAPDRGDLPTLF